MILIFAGRFIAGFLAVTKPEGKGVLVVEGWIPSNALAESAIIFNSGRYRYLVVVGGPVKGSGGNAEDLMTYADLAASRLEKLGLNAEKLVKISVPSVSFGRRTQAQARAVKHWLGDSRISVCCVDVFTMGVHARRSWTIFRYELGDDYRVGIIAGSGDSYRSRSWLVSRRGVWAVVRNLAGYLYWKLWILLHGNPSPGPTTTPTIRLVGTHAPTFASRYHQVVVSFPRCLPTSTVVPGIAGPGQTRFHSLADNRRRAPAFEGHLQAR
jgi:hypothetical protein